jgi:hypothetical protein
MHTFKDRTGRAWNMEATYASYARVRAQTGVSLFDIATEQRKSLEQLADPFTLGQVIWAMVEKEAEGRGVTPEQFFAEFDGETLDRAYTALIDEMVFFCQPRTRKILAATVERVRAAEVAAGQVVDQRMPEITAAIDEEIARWTSGSSGTSSPESSASTPAPGPSASCSQPSAAGSETIGTTPQPSSPN